jgi:N-acetylmuramoyl-L-alanine amidase
MRRFITIVVLLLCVQAAGAQYSIPVQFLRDTSRNTRVGSFERGGIAYFSLDDLTEVLHIQSYKNPETRKMQIQTGGYSIKVTAGNPFVVFTDRDTISTVAQLPSNVLYAAGAFFVPAASFLPLIDNIYDDAIAYDAPRGRIFIGRVQPKSRFDISAVNIEPKMNGYLFTIVSSKELKDYELWTKPLGNDTWVYLTIADARADVAAIQGLRGAGILKKAMAFQSATSVQLTFKLKGSIQNAEILPAEGSTNLLLTIHLPPGNEAAPLSSSLDSERRRWLLDCIVIDAGHGGEDPGTIGVAKTKEKDVALPIALKLGALIEKNLPNVRVVYTRKTDQFVELYRRGQIANAAGGKLFISIHCNSTPRKPHPANGFEIYLLRPGKNENAVRIAERENEVVKLEKDYEQRYQQLTDESFIILSMAQSAYVKYSEQFADIVRQEMDRHTEIENNGVKQAGFFVLVGASMPNVLVETGYLSNRKEEKILRSAKGQQRIAEALFNAVKRYKQEYERSLEEGMGANTLSD